MAWTGTIPEQCDVCHQPLKDKFVDGKTLMGPWAIMCLVCHTLHGSGLGVGRGQLYSVDGTKIAG